MVVLADKGVAGKAIERYAAQQAGCCWLDRTAGTNDAVSVPRRCPAVDRVGQPELERPAQPGRTRRAHPGRGYARAAQRLLAMTAAIWHNWRINADVKRSLTAYDH
jgi:hypothetical protein